MAENKINWGLIGLGNIARQFANGLKGVPGACIYGVASRDLQKAKDFRATHGALKCYGDYDSIISDPDIDIIYIATPHPQHFDIAKKALLKNKAVLCEKPITVNYKQAKELIDISRKKKYFLWRPCGRIASH